MAVERRAGEASDVPRREHARRARLEPRVHEDAVLAAKPRRLGDCGLGHDAEPRDHRVGEDLLPAAGPDDCRVAARLDRGDRLPGEDAHALLAEGAGQVGGERRRVDARPDHLLREDHRHLPPGRGERRRDLRADEAAPDDRDAAARGGVQPAVVGERAQVDDAVAARRQPARRSAGREEEALEAVDVPLVVAHLAGDWVDRERAPAGEEIEPLYVRQPDALLRLAEPQPLRERRPGVGAVGFRGEHRDPPARVHLPDRRRRGMPGHPSAHNQVLGLAHEASASWMRQFRRRFAYPLG